MYIYKMLLLNRLREYRCLIRNMLFPLLSLFAVLGIIVYQMTVMFFPILRELEHVNTKALFFIYLFLIGYSFHGCFIKVKPILIVKPITLYLFEENRIKKLLRLKMIGKAMKHLVVTFCLTIYVNGFHFNSEFFVILISLFCLLESTILLSWKIYHNKSKSTHLWSKTNWFIICITAFLSQFSPYMLIISFIIWLMLVFHSLFVLNLNRPKYEAEMIFMEKLLVAQNHNNTILLSQYAEEKKLFALSHQHKPIHKNLISKYPLTWKAKTSIYRLGKNKIMIGIVIFVITFLIYKIPVFWSLPFLEQTGIRYTLLLFGILTIFQLTIQGMLHQLDSILEKAKNGLFLPFSDKEIIVQFTIIPLIVMICVLSVLAVILKCSFIQFMIAGGILSVITILLFYLELKSKELVSKYYFVVTIIIFAISFFITYKK